MLVCLLNLLVRQPTFEEVAIVIALEPFTSFDTSGAELTNFAKQFVALKIIRRGKFVNVCCIPITPNHFETFRGVKFSILKKYVSQGRGVVINSQ